MIDFLEVGQSINVTRKYLHLLGFWEFIGRRYGELIKSSETQMFMLAVMQTGSYQPASNGGFPDSTEIRTFLLVVNRSRRDALAGFRSIPLKRSFRVLEDDFDRKHGYFE